jgi:P27 family predicted phage terminase small subunit
MPAGRPPKPAELHVLHGNPGKRGAKPAAHAITAEGLTCPDWLSPVAKAEWERVVGLLVSHGLVTVADQAVLAAYCQAYARWCEAEAVLEQSGLVIEIERYDKQGNPLGTYTQQRPEVSIAQNYYGLMLSAASKLGLDPVSRARLHAPEGGESDEFEAFLNGSQNGKDAKTGS